MLTRLPKELWIAVTWSLGGDDITRALSVSWAMRDSVNVHRLVYDRAPKVRSLEMMHVRDTVERMISRRQAIWQETDVRMHFGQRGMIVRRDSTAYIVPEIARLLRAHERLVLRVSGHPDTPGLWFPGVEDVSRAKLYKVREKELKPFTKRRARTLAAALRSEGVTRARASNARCCFPAILQWMKTAVRTDIPYQGCHIKLHLTLDGVTFPERVDFNEDFGRDVECWATVRDEFGEGGEDSSSSDSGATDV